MTGDIKLFDRLEWVAFNSMPATADKDWTGNSHYHSVNQVDAHGTTGFSPFNGCCTGNVHQGTTHRALSLSCSLCSRANQKRTTVVAVSGWPKFIMSGVQTVHGEPGSIVVSGYSPQAATLKDGTIVTVSH